MCLFSDTRMASFEMIEFIDSVTKEPTVSKPVSSLSTLMRFMEKFNFNTVQLDANQDRFRFYDSGGDVYGLLNLHSIVDDEIQEHSTPSPRTECYRRMLTLASTIQRQQL